MAPRALESVRPAYPAAALAERLEPTVVLALTIAADGGVTTVEVVSSAGPEFDEAARDAALRTRFAPARKNAEPIVARIRLAYTFTPPPLELPAASGTPAAPALASMPATLPVAAEPTLREPARAIDVNVRGAQSEAERLQHSAEAVTVVDTRRARQQTADLGEVLARTQGVGVRRAGGLGSATRISLDGLTDEQVRFYVDGVPLDLAGYPGNVGSIPVNLVSRVEVYHGVVPLRFGADALGGALNIVSDSSYQPRLSASYQTGSFGTHRFTLDGRYVHTPSHIVATASAFFDLAKNDYDIEVDYTNALGRLSKVTVPRFHDGYRALGGTFEVGIVDRPWAKRLLLRGFASTNEKAYQHNVVMTVPYGEMRSAESAYGAVARYEVDLRPNLSAELLANYARRVILFHDLSEWVYDWYGRRVRPRPGPGELGDASNHLSTQDGWFGRALVQWTSGVPAPDTTLPPTHSLRVSVSPHYVTRTGLERAEPNSPAAQAEARLRAHRDMLKIVDGLEYELNLAGGVLSNIAFVKQYIYRAKSRDVRPPYEVANEQDATHDSYGAGDSLRLRISDWLYAKVSYEYATRLPEADEVMGDGRLIQENLALEPERSHNVNVGPRLEWKRTVIGGLTIDLSAFYRDTKRLIVLLGSEMGRFQQYANVDRARSKGLETALAWSSPRGFVSLHGTLTWQDVRNTSTEGSYADFKGNRIPNRPYLFGGWGGNLRFPNMPRAGDTLEPFYEGRHVHSFYRGWESLGKPQYKQVVGAQVTHAIGVTWNLSRDPTHLAATLELDNVTDAKIFDNYGVQRPGRAFYVKLTLDL